MSNSTSGAPKNARSPIYPSFTPLYVVHALGIGVGRQHTEMRSMTVGGVPVNRQARRALEAQARKRAAPSDEQYFSAPVWPTE